MKYLLTTMLLVTTIMICAQEYNYQEMVAKSNLDNVALSSDLSSFMYEGPIAQKIVQGRHSPTLSIHKLRGNDTNAVVKIQLDHEIPIADKINDAILVYLDHQVIVENRDTGEIKNYVVLNESHPKNKTPQIWTLEVIGIGLEVNTK